MVKRGSVAPSGALSGIRMPRASAYASESECPRSSWRCALFELTLPAPMAEKPTSTGAPLTLYLFHPNAPPALPPGCSAAKALEASVRCNGAPLSLSPSALVPGSLGSHLSPPSIVRSITHRPPTETSAFRGAGTNAPFFTKGKN